MVRKRFMDDLKTVSDGGDPKSIIRSRRGGRRLHLPIIGIGNREPPGAEPHRFPFQVGQPQEIIDEMRAIWAAYAS